MNFTAKLPSGDTKDVWIAKLPVGSVFCTRRPQRCKNCGENSLKHSEMEIDLTDTATLKYHDEMKHQKVLACKSFLKIMEEKETTGNGYTTLWKPLPPVLNPRCENCDGIERVHKNGLCNDLGAPKNMRYVGKKYAICSGRGTGVICECGNTAEIHKKYRAPIRFPKKAKWDITIVAPSEGSSVLEKNYDECEKYKPLSCELLSVMAEDEWKTSMSRNIYDKVHDGKDRPNDDYADEYLKLLHEELKAEAKHEGFAKWTELDKWITDYYGARPKMWRYEFRR